MDLTAISSISKILVSSEIVIKERNLFADLTETTADRKQVLKLRLNWDEITFRDLFSELILGWVALKGREATVGRLANILREMRCIDSAEHILAQFSSDHVLGSLTTTAAETRSSSSKATFSNCDAPYNYFAGRETELQELQNVIDAPEECNLVLISGLAGIGKTEMTRIFCTKTYKKEKGTSCLWFLAEDEKILKSQLQKAAKKLKITSQEDNCIDLFDLIMENVGTEKTLVVFDNVDLRNPKVEEILDEYFRKDGVVFIVTSRDKTMLLKYNPVSIDLKALPLETAIQCVALPLNLDLDSEEVLKEITCLCEEIQCYSLALRQAVGFIRMQKKVSTLGKEYNVSDYVLKLKSSDRQKLLGAEDFDHKYKKSTLKTMCVTLDHIFSLENGEEAIRLLRFMSYVPSEDISVTELGQCNNHYLEKQGGTSQNGDDLDSGVGILKAFCLVQCEAGIINVHRMVQEVSMHYYKDWILLDADILFKVDLLLNEEQGYYECEKVVKSKLTGIPAMWKDELLKTVLGECEVKNFPDFLKRNWRPVLFTCSNWSNDSDWNWDWGWALKFLEIFRKTLGSLFHPCLVYILNGFLELSEKSEKEFLIQQFWEDCFPVEGSLELGIPKSHELFVPLDEWGYDTSLLGKLFFQIAEFFESKREWEKCVKWIPDWKLVRNSFFSDSMLHQCNTPILIYCRVLFKLGRSVEANELFDEERLFWKEGAWWVFYLENAKAGSYEGEEEGNFNTFWGSLIREHVLSKVNGLTSFVLNFSENEENTNSEVMASAISFREIIGCDQFSFFPRFFKGDLGFLLALGKLRIVLESISDDRFRQLFFINPSRVGLEEDLGEIAENFSEAASVGEDDWGRHVIFIKASRVGLIEDIEEIAVNCGAVPLVSDDEFENLWDRHLCSINSSRLWEIEEIKEDL